MSEIQHSARAHAALSASSSHRWMMCPPSVKLSGQFADKPSPYAEEGTFLHELCELKLHRYLGDMTPEVLEAQYAAHRDSDFYSDEAESVTDEYAAFCIETIESVRASCPDPLILVDGIERPLNDVDPLEIESFSVLKDASATAVYGVRGANGVILVNTRRGFDGPARIDLRYEQGFSFASKRLSFVDAATRSEMFNEAVDAVGASAALKYGSDEITAMRMQSDPELYPDVDWQKLLMRKVSLSEKVSANISGGGKFARYFTALSFYNQDGQYAVQPGKYSWVGDRIGRYGENVNYKRYNFRTNVDMDITKTTVVNLGVQGNVTENMEPVEGSAAIYRDIINAAPNAFPVRFKDGELAGRDGLNNPYNMLTQRGWKKTTGNTLRANLTINQDFSFITPGLSAKVSYAYDAVNYSVESRSRNINYFEATGRDQDGELIRTEWQADQKQEYLDYNQSGNGTRTQYLSLIHI